MGTIPPTRPIAIGLLVAMLVGLAVAGPTAAQQQDGETTIRVVHGSPLVSNLEVTVGDEVIASNLTFGNVSAYETFEAGVRNVTIVETETDKQLSSSSALLESGTNYTILAAAAARNETVDFQPKLLTDDFQAPGSNNASVRLIHAVPDVDQVIMTVRDGNTTRTGNATYRNASPYVTVPEGNYTLEVSVATANGTGERIEVRNVTLDGGTVTSAVATGYRDPEAAGVNASFTTVLVEDYNASAGGETLSEPTPGSENQTETPDSEDQMETPGFENQTEPPSNETAALAG